jgi:hypothetical protein
VTAALLPTVLSAVTDTVSESPEESPVTVQRVDVAADITQAPLLDVTV